ncbi:unnamed protein product [Ranitomeya imitator]|uniref:Uncharacterized protein n=1 Tax=Ranitomeya imitator TaxID=111125 RepID=A0ABN9KTL2_9NEOB|nr:unnamed protein product [Ranitomeya imitator]
MCQERSRTAPGTLTPGTRDTAIKDDRDVPAVQTVQEESREAERSAGGQTAVGNIGGLSTALQNAADKPLMPVVFSDRGCLGQLNNCLKTMQALDDGLRTCAASMTFTALIAECTKKKEDLDKNTADSHHNLHSILDKNKIDTRNVTSAENGVKSNPTKTNGSLEVCETDSVPQGTNMTEDNESIGLTLELLQQRYNTEKRDLEVFIQSSRDKLVAESPKGVQDMKDLQRKLHELQILLDKANRSWMEFDATSQKLEMLLHGTEKKKTSENRYALRYSFSIISEEIKSSSAYGCMRCAHPIFNIGYAGHAAVCGCRRMRRFDIVASARKRNMLRLAQVVAPSKRRMQRHPHTAAWPAYPMNPHLYKNKYIAYIHQ